MKPSLPVDEISMRPKLSFLSSEDKEKISRAALQILSEIGMKIFQDEALTLLKGAGCPVADDRVAKIPAELVQQAIATAPSNILMYNREGQQAMDLGGHRSYYGTGSDLIYSLDPRSLQRRRSLLADVVRAARVADALPNLDFIMSFANPSDFEPGQGYLRSFQAMAANSIKPIVCTADNRNDLSAMWKIACILRGSEEALRTKPYAIYYGEPVSPLKFPVDSVDKLLFCAEKFIPAIFSPAPIAGSTAPTD